MYIIEVMNSSFPGEVIFSEEEFSEFCKPWETALIGKFMGGRITTGFQYKWKLTAGFQLITLAKGYYIFKFFNPDDLEVVWANGPWVVARHVLAMEHWKKDFIPEEGTTSKLNVWG